MEFSWQLFSVAVVANLFCTMVVFLEQACDKTLPPRGSVIKGSAGQKFLYIQDFWTMTFGDWVGVSLIWAAFAHLAKQKFDFAMWMLFLVVAAMIALKFCDMCMGKEHKPDYGFPDIGKISPAGLLHLPYFGFSVAAAVSCLWLFATPGPALWIYLVGVAFYAMCFTLEIKSGNFDPLKRA